MSAIVLVYDASGAPLKTDNESAKGYLSHISTYMNEVIAFNGIVSAFGFDSSIGIMRAVYFESPTLKLPDVLVVVENVDESKLMEINDEILNAVISAFNLGAVVQKFDVKLVQIIDNYVIVMEGVGDIIAGVLDKVLNPNQTSH